MFLCQEYALDSESVLCYEMGTLDNWVLRTPRSPAAFFVSGHNAFAALHLLRPTARGSLMFERVKSLLLAPEQKASRTANVIALQSAGQARWTPRDYSALTREGYLRNAIVYRAVKLVAENAGGCAFVVEEGGATRDAHPLLDLIARPNPRQDGARLIEAIATHLLLAGNAYVEAVSVDA